MATSSVVAGFGFRAGATVASLRSALEAAFAAGDADAGQPPTLTALATPEDKATHPALIALAHELALPVVAVPLALLARQTPTNPTNPTNPPNPTKLIDSRLDPSGVAASNRIPERYGARSVAESSALAAARQGARLLAPRAVSADQMATVAIAVLIAAPTSTPTSTTTSTTIVHHLDTTPL